MEAMYRLSRDRMSRAEWSVGALKEGDPPEKEFRGAELITDH
jgi:hypothetical protein